MKLIEVQDQQTWDGFMSVQPFAQFLQSWNWGAFRSEQGKPIKRFALVDANEKWLAALQMEYRYKRLDLGYWFAPRGPIFAPEVNVMHKADVMLQLSQALLDLPELRERCLFWRIEPVVEIAQPEDLMPLSYHRNDAANPASTYLVDLTQSEEDLLASMHEKTRYNIRVAERHGVTVRTSTRAADVDAFLSLMNETAKRDGFVQHPDAYLRASFQALAAVGMARIRLAEHGDMVLAANMEVMFGDTATYLYGASSSEERQLMAPYAIHWSAIQDAKRDGYRLYDMWGANPPFKAMYYYKPSWDGISRFKKNWGGRSINLVGTWDLPFNRFLYRLAFLNKFLRG